MEAVREKFMPQALSLPHDVEFTCPACRGPVRFVIGIREGVPSDRPGGLDYFPTCPHCGTEVRITVYPVPRLPLRLPRMAALAGLLLALSWLWIRRRPLQEWEKAR
ncbi:MAG: hypothetical protein QN172_08220 [Armatimonadota bacterium]|nr:hypothetical protein [Armatimonadota bacterium]MDR7438517.1 hypothetical protein [Armatimonadota bacterium]MDR7562325.1 hypothetical protein [Armatimonadota bacterium]MDR7602430.1 hypothetical protein [Armatimonadota bacterium]